MTKARATLIVPEATRYYHCISRCVRRSYLCGEDAVSCRSYEHRRGWIEQRLIDLAKVFCIDLCAYAIMSNHYHLVLRINLEKSRALNHREVCERWLEHHKAPEIIIKWLSGQRLTAKELETSLNIIEIWRERLTNISWFMRLLNQHIAKLANQEDNCTGHFWEGRFKSQALMDEKALLAAMAYVDLNPVRAGMSDKPETAEYTSIKQRMTSEKANYLFPFCSSASGDSLPFTLKSYLSFLRHLNPIPNQISCGRLLLEREQSEEELVERSMLMNAFHRLKRGNLISTVKIERSTLLLFGRQRQSTIMEV